VDIQAANKKILRLQKERTEQDKKIETLKKAIDMFGERMLKYESEKITLEEKNEVAERKEGFINMEAEKEKKNLQNKIKLLENGRAKLAEEVKEFKVQQNTTKEEIEALRAERDEAKTKHQITITELN